MPPILAPVSNNIATAVTTFIIIMFAYHLLLKIFSLREAANNIKLLSEALKNCETPTELHVDIKSKLLNDIQVISCKTIESLNFESHYKELFGHISKLAIYAFLACILVLIGIMSGLWLTIDAASVAMAPQEITILKWVCFGCILLLGYMLWVIRDLPRSKPVIIWIGFAFTIGLVFGTSAIKRSSKPEVQQQQVQPQAETVIRP